MELTLEEIQEEERSGWLESELGKQWSSRESAQAEVRLILYSRTASRMRKPQPHKTLATSWEEWSRMAPASQVRALVAKQRRLYVVLFGKEIGADVVGEPDERVQEMDAERERKWQALPRELKLAIKRIHVNLGHANTQTLLRALRISRASETATKACRLFRCEDQEPRMPRPSKLPTVDEFNVQICMDVLQEKDSAGHG